MNCANDLSDLFDGATRVSRERLVVPAREGTSTADTNTSRGATRSRFCCFRSTREGKCKPMKWLSCIVCDKRPRRGMRHPLQRYCGSAPKRDRLAPNSECVTQQTDHDHLPSRSSTWQFSSFLFYRQKKLR